MVQWAEPGDKGQCDAAAAGLGLAGTGAGLCKDWLCSSNECGGKDCTPAVGTAHWAGRLYHLWEEQSFAVLGSDRLCFQTEK